MTKFRKITLSCTFLLIVFLLLSGSCDSVQTVSNSFDEQNNTSPDSTAHTANGTVPYSIELEGTAPPITTYFNGESPNIYRRIDEMTTLCESGVCPEQVFSRYLTNEDWIDSASHTELFSDTILLCYGGTPSTQYIATCKETGWFSYPYKLTINSMTNDCITASGKGSGYYEQSGEGCGDGQYRYSYETEETWIFTTVKLQDKVEVEAYTDQGGSELIYAPGWPLDIQLKEKIFSERGLIIECTDTQGFWVQPGLRVVEINGRPITEGNPLDCKYEKINDTKTRITFGGYYNGEFIIQVFFWVKGKNDANISAAYAMDYVNYNEETPIKDFNIKISDSPQEYPW